LDFIFDFAIAYLYVFLKLKKTDLIFTKKYIRGDVEMNVFTRQDLDVLIRQAPGAQCTSVSIYMPTFRAGADAQQGPSRLKNLIHEAETRLAESGVKSNSILKILGPVRDLLTDTFFWQNQSDGLAVFSSPQIFKYYRVPVQFKELVVAASRFNIKPLFPLITDNGRFYVLTVSQKEIKLLQCTRYLYREISLLEGMPKSLAEAMKYEDLDRQTQYHGHVGDTKYHGHIGTEAVGTTMISHGPTHYTGK
jgi:hypothetical protein